MKIAIITLNGHKNYGNRLQNYALQKFLLKYAEKVDTIWYDNNNYLPEIPSWNWKILIKCILNWKNIRYNRKYYYGKNCIREYNIKKFSDKYISIRYDFKIKDSLVNEYDYFIIGSDQVWNPYHKENRFLDFVPSKKRIAYAASFGVDHIPLQKKNLFKNKLKEMAYISVREKAGANIVYKLINKKVPVLVDPTILLSKKEWEDIAEQPRWYKNEKYILTYFLGEKNELIDNIISKYNYKIINLLDINNIDIYCSKVEEFIFLIKHAVLVCTDSFHCAVFSILMNTPFFVINRIEGNMPKTNSRINSLLELFNFKDRYISVESRIIDEEILNMDFSNVETIQSQEIERSTIYIKKALNLFQEEKN